MKNLKVNYSVSRNFMYSYCKKILFLVLVGITFHLPANAQQYDELHLVKGIDTKVYYSTGHEQRAKDIAIRTKNAIDYNYKLLGFTPDVTLLVLSVEDWSNTQVLIKLWKALRSTSAKMDDKQFASFLKRKVHPSVANVMLKW